jgi:hypothetical protein
MVGKNYPPGPESIYHQLTMLRTKLAIALGTVSLALGCGGGDGGGSSLNIEDLCGEQDGAFQIFVDKLLECTPEFELFLGQAPSAADVAAACNAQFGPFIEDGTVEFTDAADLDACVAAIMAADCLTMEIDNIPECDGLLIGQVELGDSCETNDQCAGDAYCEQSEATCGVCAELLADGVSCENNNDCASGKCRSNGACGPFAEQGDACDDDEDCVGQLVCNETCEPQGAVSAGDACAEFTECGFPFSGFFCNEQGMECEAFLELGADCNDGSLALGLCNLVEYETCDTATLKCIAPTLVGVGQQCNFTRGLKCEPGLLCEGGENGRCAETGEGAACDAAGESNTCGLFLECKEDDTCGYEDEYSGMCPAP